MNLSTLSLQKSPLPDKERQIAGMGQALEEKDKVLEEKDRLIAELRKLR